VTEKLSPEERLFRLIQEQSAGDSSEAEVEPSQPAVDETLLAADDEPPPPEPVREPAPEPDAEALPVAPAVKPIQVEPVVSGAVPLKHKRPEHDRFWLNKVLAVALVALIVLVIFVFTAEDTSTEKITEIRRAVAAGKLAALPKEQIVPVLPLSEYLAAATKRNIFSPVAAPVPEPVAAVAPEPKDEPEVQNNADYRTYLEETAAELQLVGIKWNQPDPMIMVANPKTKITHFVKEGKAIPTTGIVVKTISKTKVVISFQGEEMVFFTR